LSVVGWGALVCARAITSRASVRLIVAAGSHVATITFGDTQNAGNDCEVFGDVYERLGTHLRHAQQSYEDADSRLSRARNSVEQMAQGAQISAPLGKYNAAVDVLEALGSGPDAAAV